MDPNSPPLAEPPPSPLKQQRRALLLGAANAFDYATQFLLPVVLVRCLSAVDFGEYRLLWLALTTVLAVAPMAMPYSLYYFLPRSEPPTRRLYVHQTGLYLLAVGLLGAGLVSVWNPVQPEALHTLERFHFLLPALVVALLAANLLDILPTIEERVVWQAAAIVSFAALRSVTLGVAAWLSGDLVLLVWLLLAVLIGKFLLLLAYVARRHGLGGRWLSWPLFVGQFRHAAPFGASSALFTLRAQADQWVVASLFAVQSFAAFSIAGVLGQVVNLCRQSVNNVFLPGMSRQQANGDLAGMLAVNSRANVMVGRIVYPLLAFAFVFAEEIVTLVYTARYLEAAMVMRVYICSLLVMVVELFSITLLLREGAFALRLNLLLIALSALFSWLGATFHGLPGAAAGSVLAIYADRLATLYRISRRVGLPVHKLQDWPSLGRLIAFAGLAGLAAWAVGEHSLAAHGPVVRMLAGAFVLAGVYAALHGLGADGRRRLAAAFSPKL